MSTGRPVLKKATSIERRRAQSHRSNGLWPYDSGIAGTCFPAFDDERSAWNAPCRTFSLFPVCCGHPLAVTQPDDVDVISTVDGVGKMSKARNNRTVTHRQRFQGGWQAGQSIRFIAALVLTALTGGGAQAGDLSLLLNGKAIHINAPANKNYNESNWGAGMQYDFKAVGQDKNWIPFATVSGFKDSLKEPSYYAGGGIVRRYHPLSSFDTLHVDAGLVGFFMTRKDYKDNQPFFGMLPVLSVGTPRVAVNMTYVPKVDPKMVALVFIQLKVTLGDIR